MDIINAKKFLEKSGIDASNFSDEETVKFSEKLATALLRRIMVETREKLDDENAEVYEQMLEKGAGNEEMRKFLLEKIPGFDLIVSKIISEFKSEMKRSL